MQYVILHHTDIEHPHYDLMLDIDGVSLLQAYQLSHWPIEQETNYTITRIGDHRRIYLDYEGPVSGNRGHVRRVATGNFMFVDDSTILLDGAIKIRLK